jgi:hypothetical protein
MKYDALDSHTNLVKPHVSLNTLQRLLLEEVFEEVFV